MNSAVSSRFIVFCGIDGAGKTTIVQRLKREASLKDALFLKRAEKPNFDRLMRLSRSSIPMPEAYLQGSFADAIRWAHAFDYLRYYEAAIRPIENSGNLVFSDRWSFCSITFADAGTKLGSDVEFLLRCIPRPALTFYLDIDEKTAADRISRRGPLAEDEDLSLLAAYRAAYERYFSAYEGPLVSIKAANEDDIYSQVLAELLKCGFVKQNQTFPDESICSHQGGAL